MSIVNSKKSIDWLSFILLKHKPENNITINELEEIYLYSEFKYHDLVSLLYKNLKNFSVQSLRYLFEKSRLTYLYTFTRNYFFLQEFIRVKEKFQKCGVPLVPMKGVALLYSTYKDIAIRPMVDIDVLVQKKHLNKSLSILNELGYNLSLSSDISEKYYYKNDFHITLLKKGPQNISCSLELHWDLVSPRPYRINLPEIWRRIRKISVNNTDIFLLSPEDNIFALILHLRRYNKPLSLKYIFDISEILTKDKVDWDYIYKYSKSNRLLSLVYYTLISVKTFFNKNISRKQIQRFYPGIIRAFLLKFLINKCKDYGTEKLKKSLIFKKYTYVLLRFLLYDCSLDFIKFIVFIPIEEFACFYFIKFPSKKASILYYLRFIAMPFYSFIFIKIPGEKKCE